MCANSEQPSTPPHISPHQHLYTFPPKIECTLNLSSNRMRTNNDRAQLRNYSNLWNGITYITAISICSATLLGGFMVITQLSQTLNNDVVCMIIFITRKLIGVHVWVRVCVCALCVLCMRSQAAWRFFGSHQPDHPPTQHRNSQTRTHTQIRILNKSNDAPDYANEPMKYFLAFYIYGAHWRNLSVTVRTARLLDENWIVLRALSRLNARNVSVIRHTYKHAQHRDSNMMCGRIEYIRFCVDGWWEFDNYASGLGREIDYYVNVLDWIRRRVIAERWSLLRWTVGRCFRDKNLFGFPYRSYRWQHGTRYAITPSLGNNINFSTLPHVDLSELMKNQQKSRSHYSHLSPPPTHIRWCDRDLGQHILKCVWTAHTNTNTHTYTNTLHRWRLASWR